MQYRIRGAPEGRGAARRRGFTLIEVLMVIVIIGLLLGLLLPAINSAVTRTRETRVATEIQALASAIADFKAQFGFEPPSSLVLYENPNGWDTPDAITRESRAVLRRMFPQCNLRDLDGNGTPDGFDFNHDGQLAAANQPIELNGAECLVFFLGGIQVREDPTVLTSPVQMIGFSKNPRNPFSRMGENRLGPFFSEFNAGRLVNVVNPSGAMMEFMDPLPNQTTPYWYVSSNDGRGYRTRASSQTPPIQDDLQGSGMQDVYRQSPPPSSSNPGTAHNPKSYQIISPGYDGAYGTGGYYDPDNPNSSLARPPAGQTSRQSEAERDNITNFHPNRLAS